MPNLGTELASNVLEGIYDELENWHFEGTVTAEEVASFNLRGMLRMLQHACKDGGEDVASIIVKVVDLAREGVGASCKNTTLSDRNMGMEAKFVEARAAKSTMRKQRAGAEHRKTTLKAQSDKIQLALEK